MNGYVDGRESGAAAGEGWGCMLDGGAWMEERGLSEQGGTDQPALIAPPMQCNAGQVCKAVPVEASREVHF